MHCSLRAVKALVALAVLAALSHASAGSFRCPADCNGDGTIAAEEVRVFLGILFDESVLCGERDPNGDGRTSVADVVELVRFLAESGPDCSRTPRAPASRTPSPTATPTATPTPKMEPTPASTWISLAPMPGSGRQEVAVAELEGKIYVLGGFERVGTQPRAVDTVEAYDIASDTWEAAPPLPRRLHHGTAAVLGGFLHSVGGLDPGFRPIADVYRWRPGAAGWEELPPLPVPQGAQAVAVAGGRIHSIGGTAEVLSSTVHQIYDPTGGTWSTGAPLPRGRNHLGAAVLDGKIYVVGGRFDGGGLLNSNELDRYDPETDTWEVLAPMPTARSGIAVASVEGKLVVLGGEVDPESPRGVFGEVELYDPETGRWTSLDPMPVPRHGIGAASVGGLVYVPGGADQAGFGTTAHHDALRIFFP
ncbi:MAG: hypothetical protein KatS3mg076_3283 [Candidatus Binatia bacterium]|nr:MAG: hypothetical protein KatS3mg076_3283 [Candidatus Binatia bacterium]